MTKIKICGLTREEDILMANQYHPDYVGFVFAESKRKITDEKATALKKLLDPQCKVVGVFVNESIEHIIELCHAGTIDLIQLHGNETIDDMKELKKKLDNPIIKAIRVCHTKQIIEATKLPVNYLLFDTYVKDSYGGSGKTFNRNIIKEAYQQIEPAKRKPFFVAGGLKPENVLETIQICKPDGVDISSGVETEGRKDRIKIAQFIQSVRGQKE